MDTRTIILNFVCPVLMVSLAICLGIQNYSLAKQDELINSIRSLSLQNDSLLKENKALCKENMHLHSIYEQHIKLDVTGVSYKGGGVVVNNSMCK